MNATYAQGKSPIFRLLPATSERTIRGALPTLVMHRPTPGAKAGYEDNQYLVPSLTRHSWFDCGRARGHNADHGSVFSAALEGNGRLATVWFYTLPHRLQPV